MNEKVWMTCKEAAPLLGLHWKTVQTLCASRAITCRVLWGDSGKKVSRYLLNQAGIDEYIRSQIQPRTGGRR